MDLLIELLGFIAMAFLVGSWFPFVRRRQQLFNVFTLIAVLAFFVQFIMLSILFNIIGEGFLLTLTLLAIYNEHKRSKTSD